MRLWWDSDRVMWGPPRAKPVTLIVMLIIAFVSAAGIAEYRYAEVWTPLQRRYLPSYVRSALALTTTGRYDLVQVVDRTGSRLALDEELVSVTTAAGETSFALSDAAVKAGATRLVWQRQSYTHAALHAFLGRWIYHDQTLFDLVQPALWGAVALLLGGIIGARSQAIVHARSWRAQYAPREADWTMAPAVIDCVDRTPRSRATSVASADRPSDQVRVPIPAPLPARLTCALAAGDVTHPRAAPHAPPGSWPDPFFK